ncbi:MULTISPECIES: TA system VapC family ribonuclease toxin [Burkholderia]|uniref:TA system VapC family ribonuclease toxin n=1 Tax=Burkholderia TaxID=32008 RepID=UPI001ABA8832|nr:MULTISPECIES: TA system VapC family ribonuclease toxin [Burkholderia]
MITYLLDVNVLIALLDPSHVQHESAHAWFGRVGYADWATCPLTENGVLRIIGNPKYPNTMGSPVSVAPLVAQLRGHAGHTFWPDDVSLLDAEHVDATRLLSSAHLTDTYLLALARAHNGKLASFDRRLVVDAVPNGRKHLELIS